MLGYFDVLKDLRAQHVKKANSVPIKQQIWSGRKYALTAIRLSE